MTTTKSSIPFLIALALVFTLAACESTETDGTATAVRADGAAPAVRVGVFDSRALAIAWARSDAFNVILHEKSERVVREVAAARKAGDTERARELEGTMWELQAKLHKQGFGVWPVRDVLERIERDLPGIAEQAGVDVIVCKWDVAWRRADAELVDVTDLIVRPFDPDAETLRTIEEIRSQEPVPIEQLENHRHRD